jgi:hypothetical protein
VVARLDKAHARMPAVDLPPGMLATVAVTWHPRSNAGGAQLFWSETY